MSTNDQYVTRDELNEMIRAQTRTNQHLVDWIDYLMQVNQAQHSKRRVPKPVPPKFPEEDA